jgi:leucyl-tRNA synthetase
MAVPIALQTTWPSRSKSWVNWIPSTKQYWPTSKSTANGRSWRSGAKVEKRELDQWFFKITDYAKRLLVDLDKLSDWPEQVKTMQRNWIGKSEGAEVKFATTQGDLVVFTTRPDTLWGATFMVLAPEHPLVSSLTDPAKKATVNAYIAKARLTKEIDRARYHPRKNRRLYRAYATNPVNGARFHLDRRLCLDGLRHWRHHRQSPHMTSVTLPLPKNLDSTLWWSFNPMGETCPEPR